MLGEGAGGRLGVPPGGGGDEGGHVGLCSEGAAGVSGGVGDGERGLNGAVHGKMFVPWGLVEAWALLLD